MSQLEKAIREVMAGKTYFSDQFQDKLASNPGENPEEAALKKNLKIISKKPK
jgi:DNA-binding NarL/FixJ family response regulator